MNKASLVEKMKGIYIAFNTPFDNKGRLNTAAARDLARRYRDIGVKGLYVAGSTGEGLMMTTEERMNLIEQVVDEVGNELVVIAHIGAVATRDAMELARHAASTGVDAISAIPCVYYRLSENEIKQSWMKIIESSDLPFIIYNIPSTTSYDLSMDLFQEMVAIDKVIGIKNTTLSAMQILQFRHAAGKDFLIFNGPDEQYLAGRMMGANGGIGGSYGTMPELFLRLEELIEKQEIERAQSLQSDILRVIERMYRLASFSGAAKSVIKYRFLDIGAPRLPVAAITKDEEKIAAVIAEDIVKLVAQYKGE